MISITERLHRDLLDASLVDAAEAVKSAHKQTVQAQLDIAIAKGHLDQGQTLGSITPGFPLTNIHLAKYHLEEAANLLATYTAQVHSEKVGPPPAQLGLPSGPVLNVESSVTLAPSAQEPAEQPALTEISFAPSADNISSPRGEGLRESGVHEKQSGADESISTQSSALTPQHSEKP